MHRFLKAFASVIIIGAAFALPGSAMAAGQYIVVLKSGAPDAAAKRHGASPSHVYTHAVRGYAATLSDASLARVRRDSQVEFVTADRTVQLAEPKAKPGGGGGTAPSGQRTPTGIPRINQDRARYDSAANESFTVGVAVIDTGIERHPDLNVVDGYNCSSGTTWSDGNGHGTHVAGTIGAKDNTAGVVGVAPGTPLYAIRVLNNAGSGTLSSVVCGIDWVARNPDKVRVANMSLGGTGGDDLSCATTRDLEHRAICNATAAGVTFAVAAGNEGVDAATSAPAKYDEVITVSAWSDFNGVAGGGAADTCRDDEDDSLADFSNFGEDVDVSAPGVCILSSWKGGGFKTVSGTSMASPHVAGAAAAYLQTHPGTSPTGVKNAITLNADFSTPPSDDRDGIWEGLLDMSGGWLLPAPA